MRLCGRRYAGARRPSDEPDGTGGRLNGISRAHTAWTHETHETHGLRPALGGPRPCRCLCAPPATASPTHRFFYLSKSQFIGYPDNQPVLKSANTQIATALSGKTHSKSNSEEVGEENVNTQRHIRTGISIFIFRFYNICNGILAVFISQTSVHI